MKHFNHLKDLPLIRYPREYFENIFKKHEQNTDNCLIRIYLNKIDNRIAFRIKTKYYLEILTPETMKLFGNTKRKIIKNKR